MNRLEISKVGGTDLPDIFSLAYKVGESHVFPILSKQGQNAITQSLKKDGRSINYMKHLIK